MFSRRTMMASGLGSAAALYLVQGAPVGTAQSAPSGPRAARGDGVRRDADGARTVRLGDALFSPDDPAALVQAAGAETVRIFLRRGPWAIIWYLQDRSPVDGKPFDLAVIERQRWTNLAAETPAANYQASAFGRSFPIYGHGDFQRWVIGTRPFPLTDRLLDDWTAKGLLLPWGIGPKLRRPNQWSYMDPIPSYLPLSTGGMTPGMGTTGLRDEVGPIVHRQARYIMERTRELRSVSLMVGLSAASIPWHVRGDDGLPLLLDRAGPGLKLQQYYQNYPEERIISVSPGMQHPWVIDNAHRPNPAFIPALMTALHPFFIEEQVFSACAALNSVTPEYRGPKGRLLDEGQARDWAWSMRDVLLAWALMQTLPDRAWLPDAARFDAILSANLDRAVQAMARPGPGALGMFWATEAWDSAPNAAGWTAQRTGGRSGVYPGCITNYIPFVLDWGRRLNGDPRWTQLLTQYAQRYQAARVLATGPLAFQPLPARLEGRWARDWGEVARWTGLPPNIAQQPWDKFNRPVANPAVYDYETECPAMVYNGLKLAQATGQAGPEVDAAIALLESQMDETAVETWAAFAMRHGS
jgi:hypothetical protein